MQAYAEALRRNPRDEVAANDLAAALLRQGRAAEAVTWFRRALALRPQPDQLFNLGLALEAAGQPAEAIETYRRYLSSGGRTGTAQLEAARARLARLQAGAPGQ